MMISRRPQPPATSHPDAVGYDQLRDAPDGIERGRGRSDRLRLPHERDEAPRPAIERDLAPYPPNEEVKQAARDVSAGLVDTERRGTPSDLPPPRRRGRRTGLRRARR